MRKNCVRLELVIQELLKIIDQKQYLTPQMQHYITNLT